MDINRMKWQNEMENMLAAINRETARSLRAIKLIFKQCGLSLPSDFKQHFLQASSNRIKLTYEQFEIDSLFEESMNNNLGSVAIVAGASSNRGQSGLKSEASNSLDDVAEIDDSDDDVVSTPTFNVDTSELRQNTKKKTSASINLGNASASASSLTTATVSILSSDDEDAPLIHIQKTMTSAPMQCSTDLGIVSGSAITVASTSTSNTNTSKLRRSMRKKTSQTEGVSTSISNYDAPVARPKKKKLTIFVDPSNESQLLCPVEDCEEKFSSKHPHNVNRHVFETHGFESNGVWVKERWQCAECPKDKNKPKMNALRSDNLKSHFKIHHPGKDFDAVREEIQCRRPVFRNSISQPQPNND